MVIAQCEVWWADLAEPIGSATGYRRPVVVVQSDPLNQSQIATVDKRQLTDRVGKIPKRQMEAIFSGIDLVMGRQSGPSGTCSRPPVSHMMPRRRMSLARGSAASPSCSDRQAFPREPIHDRQHLERPTIFLEIL